MKFETLSRSSIETVDKSRFFAKATIAAAPISTNGFPVNFSIFILPFRLYKSPSTSVLHPCKRRAGFSAQVLPHGVHTASPTASLHLSHLLGNARSEERRVGK